MRSKGGLRMKVINISINGYCWLVIVHRHLSGREWSKLSLTVLMLNLKICPSPLTLICRPSYSDRLRLRGLVRVPQKPPPCSSVEQSSGHSRPNRNRHMFISVNPPDRLVRLQQAPRTR